ncbi:hypothetical protein MTP99_003062 [Tenebrio molitor]|nr:hypothetical protein MTP99_003062 [Tenebrio molitor]
MTFLRAGIPGDEFSHILSFRRQIFIQPLEGGELPSSIVIKYDDTNYRIFLTDDLTCFRCKLQGHTAANCPEYPPENTRNTTPNEPLRTDDSTTYNRNMVSLNQDQIEPHSKDLTTEADLTDCSQTSKYSDN